MEIKGCMCTKNEEPGLGHNRRRDARGNQLRRGMDACRRGDLQMILPLLVDDDVVGGRIEQPLVGDVDRECAIHLGRR